MNGGEPDTRNEKNKKKKKKVKKKKKKGKDEVATTDVQPVETKKKPPKKLDPIEPAPQKDEDGEKCADAMKKKSKLPGCFGFISTWLAKQKQKRRDKKKKAIASRNNLPDLVQYEHKKAKGGEAFVIEVECRPIVQKPLLPPIKRTSGPIRRGTYGQLQTAEDRRLDELARRRAAATTYERKKSKCKARKSELDNLFRKKADLTIRYKQADAERNRNSRSRRITTTTRSASIQSSSCESMSIEGDVSAFIQDEDSDPDAWKVDDVDIFSY